MPWTSRLDPYPFRPPSTPNGFFVSRSFFCKNPQKIFPLFTWLLFAGLSFLSSSLKIFVRLSRLPLSVFPNRHCPSLRAVVPQGSLPGHWRFCAELHWNRGLSTLPPYKNYLFHLNHPLFSHWFSHISYAFMCELFHRSHSSFQGLGITLSTSQCHPSSPVLPLSLYFNIVAACKNAFALAYDFVLPFFLTRSTVPK